MATAGGRITASSGVNLIGQHAADRNQEATVYVGNIDIAATEELVWELFVQAGPVGESAARAGGRASEGQAAQSGASRTLAHCFWCRAVCAAARSSRGGDAGRPQCLRCCSPRSLARPPTRPPPPPPSSPPTLSPAVNVYMPKDRVTNQHQSYGFVEFRSEEDCEYAIKILNMCKLHGKPIRVNKAASDKNLNDVGANLFIGNLDPDVDEKVRAREGGGGRGGGARWAAAGRAGEGGNVRVVWLSPPPPRHPAPRTPSHPSHSPRLIGSAAIRHLFRVWRGGECAKGDARP